MLSSEKYKNKLWKEDVKKGVDNAVVFNAGMNKNVKKFPKPFLNTLFVSENFLNIRNENANFVFVFFFLL